jgi:hypothetical protein
MNIYARLHRLVQDTDTRWHTEPLTHITYDTDLPPFSIQDTMLWVEPIAELFPMDDMGGPAWFDTVTYPWGTSVDYFHKYPPLEVVPTVHYWVCQGHEWA